MSEQLLLRIAPELKARLARLARAEGRTASEVVRELIEGYVQERDIGGYIDALWVKIGSDLKARGVGARDVSAAVKRVRSGRKAAGARRR
jgi:hypothetical protein